MRVRATCVKDGVTRSGQSDFFTVPADGIIRVADIVFDDPQPVAATLSLTAPATTLTSAGQTAQLAATASYPDGSTADVSVAAAGTSYTISNPAIATVDAGGLVTALASGTVLVSAANEGALGLITLRVVLSGDSDGDGLPDDFELANGLDPGDPADAFADPDADGLGNLDEFQRGLDLFDPDTDGDQLSDGDEVTEEGTDPLLFDTDGDLVSDGLEILAGSSPLDPLSVDLAPILESFTVEPPSFELTFNTVIGEASRRLRATATLIDGTVLDATGPPYGTAYASSDLTIASFGLEAGRVFAGADGTATVTASSGAFSANAEVTVRTVSPTALSFLRIPGFANSVTVQGDYAYVAAGARGLYVVDVSNPSAPFIAGSSDTPRNANAVAVEGGYAFVADGTWDVRLNSHLRVIDVSDPTNPVYVTRLTVGGFAVGVAVDGDRAYLAAGSRGIHIIDVSDPEVPIQLGEIDVDARRLDVSGDLVMAAGGSAGVTVIDAGDPAHPIVLGSTHTRPGSRSAAADVVVRDRQVWVADGYGFRLGGLRAIDLTEPLTPVVVGTTSDAFGLSGVALEGDFVVASDIFYANAVPIFHVGEPAPVFRAVLDFSGPPSFRDDEGIDVAVQGGLIFLTGASGPGDQRSPGDLGDTGLHIGRYLDPEAIGNVPPEVTLIEPTDGDTVFERRLITLRAEAVDDVRIQVVEFLVDGEVVHEDFSSPFEHSFRAPQGGSSLTLGARARDRGGNQGLAEDVVLQVLPDTLPTLAFAAPPEGSSVTEGATISVALRATDDVAVDSVELFAGGVSLGILTAPPFRYDVAVPLGSAELALTATVTDDGGQTTAADPLVVSVVPDQPPLVAIADPADGSEIAARSQLRVTAVAADDLGVAGTSLWIDGQLERQDSEPPYEFGLLVPASASELLLRVEAVDTRGQTGVSSEVRVTVIPDPSTTVFGRVLDPLGQTVTGADVTTLHGGLALSDAGGFFLIPDQPTIEGDLAVSASALIEGVSFVGVSASVAPYAAGITDVGDVVLEEELSADACPCNNLQRWISDGNPAGFDVWSAAELFDPTSTVCVRDALVTELLVPSADSPVKGAVANATLGECRAFDFNTFLGGALSGLTSAEVNACRQHLETIADSKGIPCNPPPPECPCSDASNWDDVEAGKSWESFASRNFIVQATTCIDSAETTSLVEDIPEFGFFRAVAASASLAECQVFDVAGDPPSATLAIETSEVDLCRDVLRNAAADKDLVCGFE